jgi:hypothetical protein
MTQVNDLALSLICLSQALATEAFLSREGSPHNAGNKDEHSTNVPVQRERSNRR